MQKDCFHKPCDCFGGMKFSATRSNAAIIQIRLYGRGREERWKMAEG